MLAILRFRSHSNDDVSIDRSKFPGGLAFLNWSGVHSTGDFVWHRLFFPLSLDGGGGDASLDLDGGDEETSFGGGGSTPLAPSTHLEKLPVTVFLFLGGKLERKNLKFPPSYHKRRDTDGSSCLRTFRTPVKLDIVSDSDIMREDGR